MDFVTIGNPNNVADTTGSPNPVGSVGYIYNLCKYEISRDMIDKANSLGGMGISMYDMSQLGFGGNGLNRPATGINWNEAARFVNWLNTSKGYQVAYNFTTGGANDNVRGWGAGQYIANNKFRHKDAYYFLPSRDEWYKGAFGNPNGPWYDYATASDATPALAASTDFQGWRVSGGTSPETAVYNIWGTGPADITDAGGLSAYSTMAQNGNVHEWTESAWDLTNDSGSESREVRGGSWSSSEFDLRSTTGRFDGGPQGNDSWFNNVGFRVAMIPEPSSLSLLAMGGVVVGLIRRKRT